MRVLQSTYVAFSIVGLLVTASNPAPAQTEPAALIDSHRCMFCHTTDSPFLAPSFQQIAERYRKVPNARLMLENKLRLGGKAHWGDTAMPLPADRGGPITPEDTHTLIVWVLSQ